MMLIWNQGPKAFSVRPMNHGSAQVMEEKDPPIDSNPKDEALDARFQNHLEQEAAARPADDVILPEQVIDENQQSPPPNPPNTHSDDPKH
jgi:hypothetical protein